MQRVEANVKRIVREVAEECQLPIETDKEEVLHIRKSRKGRMQSGNMSSGWG